ncbi:LacI family DNA-binding transcriptional regulator [Clostridium sediminicola]|uniref:LacI family DNA-binding transcriptional regulator n=1 Tax=Clostridium sediminicola TaxID=3114879 RepID=UPI0031F225C3
MKKDGSKFATLSDVAKLANVSTITASRVYNPKWKGKVRETTVEKVHKAAKELGYNPNGIARSLISQKTNIIAVVIGPNIGFFYERVLTKLIFKIQATGRQALIFVADPSVGMEAVVAQVHHYRVDAIIVTSPATRSNIMNYFTNSKIPIILFNRAISNTNASAVWSDTIKAVDEVADFLVLNGHKFIGCVSGEKKAERNEAFIEKLKEYNKKPVYIYEGDYSYESGYKAAIQMLTASNPPDAIFCAGDDMAMGVLDAARIEMGLNIPEDLSVIGFDDNPVAKKPAYDLTTVRQPVHEMIDATIEIIEELLENPEKQILKKIKMELVIRSTVKICK